MQTLSLDLIEPSTGAQVSQGEACRFTTPVGRWEYALLMPLPDLIDTPCVIEVLMSDVEGQIGVGCTNASKSDYEVGEQHVTPAGEQSLIRLLVTRPLKSGWLVFRNTAPAGGVSSAVLSKVSIKPADVFDPIEIKEMRAAQGYWHYEFDLGDGVHTQTTAPESMGYLELVKRSLCRLLSETFCSLDRKRILDAGCASGFHSFELARQFGLTVDGIDVDPREIDQARFVRSCLTEVHAEKVAFTASDLLTFSPDDRYDFFYCSGVFYHLLDPVGAAQRLYDLVREGGVLHCCVTGDDDQSMKLASHDDYIFCFSGEFSFVPSAPMLMKILQHVGFSDVRCAYPSDILSKEEQRAVTMNSQHRALLDTKTAFFVVKK